MLTKNDILFFLNSRNYDLKNSHNGRWIDQKCTPDVISVVADCIQNYAKEYPNEYFTTTLIWHNSYTIVNVEDIFRKPGVNNIAAKNEYDKFFQQPMEMLAYAGVLEKDKRGKRNYYRVLNHDILEYIAIRERNALVFTTEYIKKVLIDSGIYSKFEHFLSEQTNKSYRDVKQGYSEFIINNTPINGTVECNRIFIKVLNILAYQARACGTKKGRMSEHPITYDMLMYNRDNFRDVFANKPKGVTRKEYLKEKPIAVNEAYYMYQSKKAKRFLKKFNDENRNGKTEYLDSINERDKATQIHHIFSVAEFPTICYYLENLIALTPTQHFNYAHPNGKTIEIDEQYQHMLLLSKADRIKENIMSKEMETIYEFSNFIYVLNVGFDDDNILEIADMDFVSVMNAINTHYA